MEAIRQAQREWKLAKRRELEAKAQKKRFKRASLSASQPAASQSVAHGPHVSAAALFSHVAAPQPVATHQVQLLHGNIFAHSSDIQHMHIHPTSAAAIHQSAQTHPHLMPQYKAPGVTSEAAALHHHLNANAKRARSALEEVDLTVSPDDVADVAVTPTAATVYAATAANHLGIATSIPMTASVMTGTVPLSAQEGVFQQQQHPDAHKVAMDQYEAQRRWREMKRREIEMKRAKGAGSKRGRKKARHSVPPAISAATAQLQESVSVAIASTPSINVASAPMQSAVETGYGGVGAVENIPTAQGGHGTHIVEDPAVMYVKSAPSGEGAKDVEDIGSAVREAEENAILRDVDESAAVRDVEDNTAEKVIEVDVAGRDTEGDIEVRNIEDDTVAEEAEEDGAERKAEGDVAESGNEDKTAVGGHGDNTVVRETEHNTEALRYSEGSGTAHQPMDIEMPTSEMAGLTARRDTEDGANMIPPADAEKPAGSSSPSLHEPLASATSADARVRLIMPIVRSNFTDDPSQPTVTVVATVSSNASDEAQKDHNAHCDKVNVNRSKAVHNTSEKVGKDREENEKAVDDHVVREGEGEGCDQQNFAAEDIETATGEANGSKTDTLELSNAESTEPKKNITSVSESDDEATKNEAKIYDTHQDTLKTGEAEKRHGELNDGEHNDTAARDEETGDDAEADAKADEFQVNGEDIMSAAAWQSLDSIGNT